MLWGEVVKKIDEWQSAWGLECEPPTFPARATVLSLVHRMDKDNVPSPDRVDLDGNGGVILGWRDHEHYTTINVGDQADITAYLYRNSKLVKYSEMM